MKAVAVIRRSPQNGVREAHTSEAQKDGSRWVLNRDCREDKGKENEGEGFCG